MSDPKKGPKNSSRRGRAAEPHDTDRFEHETEAYTLQVFFDPQSNLFCASFLEFPELGSSDESRTEAIYLVEDKLHSHLAALRQSGKPVPAPVHTVDYPTHIELPVSQTLYRKLEAKRHQERVTLEQMVTEILTAAVDKRADAEPRASSGGGGKNRGGAPGNRSQRGQGGGRGGRGNFHNTMESRENFMEYVRNLEKSGGPGFKKR